MRIENLQNENRKFTKSIGNFHVLEYVQDASVSPMNAMNEYFMSKMNVRRKQVVIDIDKDHSAVIQSGSMQWMGGNVQATSGVKGIGDFLGKALKGAVTKETAVKPEYVGEGCLVLEPTYKYIILADIGKWGSAGMTIEDGMFLACDANVKSKVVPRKNLSSAVLGSEGLFNLILSRLVDTFFSRISPTMQLPPKHHSIAYVLPWAEGLHWQSRSSGCSNS